MATRYADQRHPKPLSESDQSTCCHDLIKISVGWTLLVAIVTFLLGADIDSGHRVPWSLAWIFYLPSLVTLCKGLSDPSEQLRSHQVAGIHTCLGLMALIYIFTTMMSEINPVPLNGCDPTFYGKWIDRGRFYCPNLFEYRWGFWGQAIPVATATLITSLGYLSYLVFRLQAKTPA